MSIHLRSTTKRFECAFILISYVIDIVYIQDCIDIDYLRHKFKLDGYYHRAFMTFLEVSIKMNIAISILFFP